MSRVCNKHGVPEFCPDDVCRWCPPEPETPTVEGMLYGSGGFRAQWDPAAAPTKAMPPHPIANCLHDGALFDFGNVVSCAACGKILPSKPALPPPCLHDRGLTPSSTILGYVCKWCMRLFTASEMVAAGLIK